MRVFLLNLAIALLWTFLDPKPALPEFLFGFGMGFVLVWLGRGLFPESRYVPRSLAFVGFVLGFGREFLRSNAELAAAALFRRPEDIASGFLEYDTSGLGAWEVLLLSHCITLTPGTTTVEISGGGDRLLLHAFDASDPERVRRDIDRMLRDPLLRWTR